MRVLTMNARRILVAGLLPVLCMLGLSCAPHGNPSAHSESAKEVKIEVAPAAVAIPNAFKDRIDAALEHVKSRDLRTTSGFWTILHGILGLGMETTLLNEETNERVKAIDYIREGKLLPKYGMVFEIMGDAGVDVQTQPGTGLGQGHQDQFIAEMAQWGMKEDEKFLVNGKEYTFGDFTRFSKMRAQVTTNQELSWAIVIIGQYFGTDISWTNRAGEKLNYEDLVRYELNQSIAEAACGGTHRLFGLTWVYHLHMQRGGKKIGVWKDVADKIEFYKKEAHRLQNPDGSFATGYLSTPGRSTDMTLRISTTGHVLEWLALALTNEELNQAWMQEAVNALVMTILESRADPIEGGALYHAAHGLYIYRARMYGVAPAGLHLPQTP